MQFIFDVHKYWGYVGIGLNAIAGLYALAAWRWKSLRGKPLWILTIVAESDLVLFGDGIEADAVALAWGQQVTLRIAPQRLHLV